MSEDKKPEIEFVLTVDQKLTAARLMNDLMMSRFTNFSDDEWQLENVPDYVFHLRIITGAGWLKIPLTDAQIVDLLNQLMDGTKERQAIIGEILADVTE
jgi:hypothetical protein